MPDKHERILPRGFGRISSSFNLALVGSLHLVTDGAGATSSGVRAKNPAMKSSTMKGAKALESKLCVETVPNREQSSLAGKGTLLVSCPRNRRLCLRKLCPAGRLGHGAMVRRLVLLATSTTRQTPSLIREGPLQPPVVRRCLAGVGPLAGTEVIETQRTGRVVQVEVASPSFKGSRSRLLQGSGRLVPRLGGTERLKRTTKERTGRTRHQ